MYVYVCVRPGIQSEDQNQFFTFKVRIFWQSEVKISVLALWLCALSSLFHNMGVGGYGRNPLFVRARHVQRCVKKCPHFECVIHRFVLALNAWTNTLYTHVYIVSSLWMPGQVGVCMYVVIFGKIDHCIRIHWCIPMGLGHNDPWVESHMWPQQMWGQRSSRGQWPLLQVLAKRFTVSTYFDVFS